MYFLWKKDWELSSQEHAPNFFTFYNLNPFPFGPLLCSKHFDYLSLVSGSPGCVYCSSYLSARVLLHSMMLMCCCYMEANWMCSLVVSGVPQWLWVFHCTGMLTIPSSQCSRFSYSHLFPHSSLPSRCSSSGCSLWALSISSSPARKELAAVLQLEQGCHQQLLWHNCGAKFPRLHGVSSARCSCASALPLLTAAQPEPLVLTQHISASIPVMRWLRAGIRSRAQLAPPPTSASGPRQLGITEEVFRLREVGEICEVFLQRKCYSEGLNVNFLWHLVPAVGRISPAASGQMM